MNQLGRGMFGAAILGTCFAGSFGAGEQVQAVCALIGAGLMYLFLPGEKENGPPVKG